MFDGYLLSDLKTFYNHYNKPDGEGGYTNSVWEKIMEYEDIIGKNLDSQQIESELEEYCKKYSFSENITDIEEVVNYDYFKIRNDIAKLNSEFEQTQKRLVGVTKAFIEDSIKFINE